MSFFFLEFAQFFAICKIFMVLLFNLLHNLLHFAKVMDFFYPLGSLQVLWGWLLFLFPFGFCIVCCCKIHELFFPTLWIAWFCVLGFLLGCMICCMMMLHFADLWREVFLPLWVAWFVAFFCQVCELGFSSFGLLQDLLHFAFVWTFFRPFFGCMGFLFRFADLWAFFCWCFRESYDCCCSLQVFEICSFPLQCMIGLLHFVDFWWGFASLSVFLF